MPTLTYADVFAGGGGLCQGFRTATAAAGWDRAHSTGDHYAYRLVFALDNDPDAMATFRLNHADDVPPERHAALFPIASSAGLHGEDILRAANLSSLDVLVGGPNCQGVSTMGARDPHDPRNQRFYDFARLVREAQPLWFCIENVPGLTSTANADLFRSLLDTLAEIPGYRVAADVLLAASYGTAQMRWRLVIIGTRTDRPILFPLPDYAPTPDLLDDWGYALYYPQFRAVSDAIGFLRAVPPRPAGDATPIPLTLTDHDGSQRTVLIHNHTAPQLAPHNQARVAAVAPGKDWHDIPIGLLPERFFAMRVCDARGLFGRLHWDKPARTITTESGNPSAGSFIHPQHDRPITPREAALLQGFPFAYRFHGSTGTLYRLIGNKTGLDHAVLQVVRRRDTRTVST